MRVAAVILCAGCNYNPHAGTPDSELPADTATLLPDTGDASEPDSPIAMAQPCETPSQLGLLLCYQFDGDLGQLDDSSPNNFDDPTVTDMTAVTRTVNGVTSQAALIGPNVDAHLPQDVALELTNNYTIVAWIRPINPSTNNDGIADHNGQWAFSVENQQITCWWSRPTLQKSLVPISGPFWQLAACVITGTTGCAYRIDETGAPTMSCRSDLTGAAPAGNSGVSIGSFEGNGGSIEERFRGEIDDLRVYKRALTTAELCVIAGRPGCL